MMNLLANFKNIKWSFKLMALSFSPALASIIVAVLSVYFLVSHADENIDNVAAVKHRQDSASQVLESIHNSQVSLISLVASARSEDIREFAIESIKSFSVIDETIAGLQSAMPDSSLVVDLQTQLLSLKPISMNVIAFGKKNQDEAAMSLLADNKNQYDQVQLLAGQILSQQQENFKLLANKNKRESVSIGWIIAIVVSVSIIITIVIVMLTSRYLSSALRSVNQGMIKFSEGDLRSSNNEKYHDEIGQAKQTLDVAIAKVKQIVLGIRSETRNINLSATKLDDLSLKNNTSLGQITNDIQSANTQILELQNLGASIHQLLDNSAALTNTAAQTNKESGDKITLGLIKLEELRDLICVLLLLKNDKLNFGLHLQRLQSHDLARPLEQPQWLHSKQVD